eukprot:jgi/Ulvmu1/3198/UM015_0239.1
MQLASIVSMHHASEAAFVDEEHLCYPIPSGVIIEHIATGRQKHVWWDQKLCEPVGPSIFAVDHVNGHIALHQDDTKKTVRIVCTHTLQIIDTLILSSDAAGGVDDRQGLIHHMSFSSDGLHLMVAMWTQGFVLCLFSRPSSTDAFLSICSQQILVSSPPCPPTFCPGRSQNLCWLDEGSINIIRLEPVLECTDVKHCHIDVTGLAASEALTAHTWHNGSLLVGSKAGKLFIVKEAAVDLAQSHKMDPVSSSMFLMQPILEEELSKWTAGAIVGLHVISDKLAIVFECPDGQGGILLWASMTAIRLIHRQGGLCATGSSALQQSSKAVNLPMSRIVFSASSPNQSQIAVIDDTAQILVMQTDTDPDSGSHIVASTSHCGEVIGIEPVQGTPAAAGVLFFTLDITGRLCAFLMEPKARTSMGDITAKLTMLQIGMIGSQCAALAAHPVFPLLAVATTAGDVHLIGALEFTRCGRQGEAAEGSISTCVQFSAHALDPGCKVLAWSPDGAVLACLASSKHKVILLRRKSSPLHKQHHILTPHSSVSMSHTSLLRWHQSESSMPVLIGHQAQGHLVIMDLPRETGESSAPIALATVTRAAYRLTVPLTDMHVLQTQCTDTHICIIGACLDHSIRKFRMSTERVNAKQASMHVLPVATIEAEMLQV